VASYTLVDLEKIPQSRLPKSLPDDVLVWVFAGHNQTKIPLDPVEKLLGPVRAKQPRRVFSACSVSFWHSRSLRTQQKGCWWFWSSVER
jgi:hypothetical protein